VVLYKISSIIFQNNFIPKNTCSGFLLSTVLLSHLPCKIKLIVLPQFIKNKLRKVPFFQSVTRLIGFLCALACLEAL
jgi:hypothetical protein